MWLKTFMANYNNSRLNQKNSTIQQKTSHKLTYKLPRRTCLGQRVSSLSRITRIAIAAGIQEPHQHGSIQSPWQINGAPPRLCATGLPLPAATVVQWTEWSPSNSHLWICMAPFLPSLKEMDPGNWMNKQLLLEWALKPVKKGGRAHP